MARLPIVIVFCIDYFVVYYWACFPQ